jgi:predicted transcriptional regulator
MDLGTYIESRNISQKEFADMLGVRASTVSNYICGRRLPNSRIGRGIEKLTKNKVTIDDMIKKFEEGKKKYG